MQAFEKPARTLKVLGHPLRLKIAAVILDNKICVRDICSCLGLPQAVISQHLALLKANGIIEGRRHGVEMHYSITDPLAVAVLDFLKR